MRFPQPKVLPNGNLLVKSDRYWIDEEEDKWEEIPAWKAIRLEARGGYDICDEWRFSGSYSIDVKPGEIGNCYYYGGSLYGDYHKIKYRNGRRTRGPKFDLHLSVCYPTGRIGSHVILRRKGVSLRKAKMLIVDAIRKYEATDHFKKEIWPQVLHPDRRTQVVKDVNGEFIWIASTWDSLWNYVRTRNVTGYNSNITGYGYFYSRSIEVEKKYPKDENGRTNYDAEPEISRKFMYSHVENGGGFQSGGGLDANKREELQAKINAAIYDLNDMTGVYIARQKIENAKWSGYNCE